MKKIKKDKNNRKVSFYSLMQFVKTFENRDWAVKTILALTTRFVFRSAALVFIVSIYVNIYAPNTSQVTNDSWFNSVKKIVAEIFIMV